MSARSARPSMQPDQPESRSAAAPIVDATQSYPARPDDHPTVIDCDRCSVRGIGCGDCVVTFLLGAPPVGVPLADDERKALDVLADAGLIPPLRMVEPVDTLHPEWWH
jgi:hypothetical protein